MMFRHFTVGIREHRMLSAVRGRGGEAFGNAERNPNGEQPEFQNFQDPRFAGMQRREAMQRFRSGANMPHRVLRQRPSIPAIQNDPRYSPDVERRLGNRIARLSSTPDFRHHTEPRVRHYGYVPAKNIYGRRPINGAERVGYGKGGAYRSQYEANTNSWTRNNVPRYQAGRNAAAFAPRNAAVPPSRQPIPEVAPRIEQVQQSPEYNGGFEGRVLNTKTNGQTLLVEIGLGANENIVPGQQIHFERREGRGTYLGFGTVTETVTPDRAVVAIDLAQSRLSGGLQPGDIVGPSPRLRSPGTQLQMIERGPVRSPQPQLPRQPERQIRRAPENQQQPYEKKNNAPEYKGANEYEGKFEGRVTKVDPSFANSVQHITVDFGAKQGLKPLQRVHFYDLAKNEYLGTGLVTEKVDGKTALIAWDQAANKGKRVPGDGDYVGSLTSAKNKGVSLTPVATPTAMSFNDKKQSLKQFLESRESIRDNTGFDIFNGSMAKESKDSGFKFSASVGSGAKTIDVILDDDSSDALTGVNFRALGFTDRPSLGFAVVDGCIKNIDFYDGFDRRKIDVRHFTDVFKAFEGRKIEAGTLYQLDAQLKTASTRLIAEGTNGNTPEEIAKAKQNLNKDFFLENTAARARKDAIEVVLKDQLSKLDVGNLHEGAPGELLNASFELNRKNGTWNLTGNFNLGKPDAYTLDFAGKVDGDTVKLARAEYKPSKGEGKVAEMNVDALKIAGAKVEVQNGGLTPGYALVHTKPIIPDGLARNSEKPQKENVRNSDIENPDKPQKENLFDPRNEADEVRPEPDDEKDVKKNSESQEVRPTSELGKVVFDELKELGASNIVFQEEGSKATASFTTKESNAFTISLSGAIREGANVFLEDVTLTNGTNTLSVKNMSQYIFQRKNKDISSIKDLGDIIRTFEVGSKIQNTPGITDVKVSRFGLTFKKGDAEYELRVLQSGAGETILLSKQTDGGKELFKELSVTSGISFPTYSSLMKYVQDGAQFDMIDSYREAGLKEKLALQQKNSSKFPEIAKKQADEAKTMETALKDMGASDILIVPDGDFRADVFFRRSNGDTCSFTTETGSKTSSSDAISVQNVSLIRDDKIATISFLWSSIDFKKTTNDSNHKFENILEKLDLNLSLKSEAGATDVHSTYNDISFKKDNAEFKIDIDDDPPNVRLLSQKEGEKDLLEGDKNIDFGSPSAFLRYLKEGGRPENAEKYQKEGAEERKKEIRTRVLSSLDFSGVDSDEKTIPGMKNKLNTMLKALRELDVTAEPEHRTMLILVEEANRLLTTIRNQQPAFDISFETKLFGHRFEDESLSYDRKTQQIVMKKEEAADEKHPNHELWLKARNKVRERQEFIQGPHATDKRFGTALMKSVSPTEGPYTFLHRPQQSAFIGSQKGQYYASDFCFAVPDQNNKLQHWYIHRPDIFEDDRRIFMTLQSPDGNQSTVIGMNLDQVFQGYGDGRNLENLRLHPNWKNTVYEACVRASKDRASEIKDAADLKSFDLPKNKKIAYLPLTQRASFFRDKSFNAEAEPERRKEIAEKQRELGQVMKAAGYKMVSLDGKMDPIYVDSNTNPVKVIDDYIAACRKENIRDVFMSIQAHGSHEIAFDTGGGRYVTMSYAQLMSIFKKYPDMNFTLFGIMCHGAWDGVDQRRVLTDPGGRQGRVTIITQTKSNELNSTASEFEPRFKYYIMQGKPVGEAIRDADEATKRGCNYNPEVWRSGSTYNEVTETADISAPTPPDTQVA